MKKNNKGFFLAETIVMIALVTSIMAFVYPNVSKLYENYKDRAVYYDQTEDIYILRYLHKYLLEENKLKIDENLDYKNLQEIEDVPSHDFGDINLKKLYITEYLASPTSDDYDFKRYISRFKKTTYDTSSYRLIGIFADENGKTRYASIKIDNPNSVSIVGDDNE